MKTSRGNEEKDKPENTAHDIDRNLLVNRTKVLCLLEEIDREIERLSELRKSVEEEGKVFKEVEDALLAFLGRTEEAVARLSFAINLFLKYIFPELSLVLRTQKDEDGMITGIQFLVDDGNETRPIYDFYGASVVEIIFFALTILLSILSGRNRIIVMDEPLKTLSEENWVRVTELASSMCKKYDIQIILTTHHDCESLKRFSNISVYNIGGGDETGRRILRPGEDPGRDHVSLQGAEVEEGEKAASEPS